MKRQEILLEVKYESLLLEYLLKNITNKSKNTIKKLLQVGLITVNDNVITKHDYIALKGDIIKIRLHQIEKFNNKDNINILYEDEYLIIVDKIFGLLTVGTLKEKENTLYKYVSLYVKKYNKNNKIFIVNRLDKDTSGIVVFAKNESIKDYMQNNWDNIVKLREYTATVHGKVTDGGIIKSYLKENKEHFVYSSSTGKLAVTEYEVIKSMNNSMLRIILHTGRKNQIRVHMKDINHPVLGDKKYGIKDNYKRLMLHANKLSFIHPVTKKLINVNSNIPKELNDTI